MIKEKKETLYSLVCDNCGKQFEHPFEGCVEFWDKDYLLEEAEDYNWRGLYGGKIDPDEPEDLSLADQHFCSYSCREEYLEKKATSAPAPHFRESETRQISKS